MSSIYKKGRDGYYYYQTYVNNPESGKKDKRIFHALRTKDLAEAKVKQSELDLKYEKKVSSNASLLNTSYNINLKLLLVIILLTIAITLSFSDYFKLSELRESNLIVTNVEKDGLIKKINSDTLKVIEPSKRIIYNNKDSINIKAQNLEFTDSQQQKTPKISFPNYNLVRVERLSDAFEQCKIYVTTDKNASNESQLLLCESLTTQFRAEFSNIIICLYSPDSAGKNLANGFNEKVNIEEKNKSWLAMYTYNAVEGAYFDDNPSGYLGVKN